MSILVHDARSTLLALFNILQGLKLQDHIGCFYIRRNSKMSFWFIPGDSFIPLSTHNARSTILLALFNIFKVWHYKSILGVFTSRSNSKMSFWFIPGDSFHSTKQCLVSTHDARSTLLLALFNILQGLKLQEHIGCFYISQQFKNVILVHSWVTLFNSIYEPTSIPTDWLNVLEHITFLSTRLTSTFLQFW